MFSESLMKKLGLFCRRCPLRDSRGKDLIQQRCEEGLYGVYGGCASAQRDCVMKTVTTVQENAEDILAEAQQINEERAAQEAKAVQETEEDGVDPSDEGTM